ncbi:MAG: sulfatase [Pirellulales bacterium]|nr:sulfatase [Pirellulales bacterium]
MRSTIILLFSLVFFPTFRATATAAEPPDKGPLCVLLMTADDLDRQSLASFGSKRADVTPNLDRLASQGMRFLSAHVNVAICQPSRGVLATGRYGHNSGITGFVHTTRDVPTVMETLQARGYLTGVLGKVEHSTPKASFRWDFVRDQGELGAGRDPQKYYDACKEFFDRCRSQGKPFYFMVNSHDPHRPFHVPGKPIRGAVEPSRTFAPSDVDVPGFVPDLPGVRRELSHYLNSARRCDDTFGRVLAALTESGHEDRTLVVFLSDNGIAIPFAKCNTYLASTRTPWIVRWPGVVKPGSANEKDFISGVDFFPTVLEALGLPRLEGLDGRSFAPLLRGEKQAGRDRVFTQIDRKAGGDAVPMRAVQDHQFGYIYSAWSDGRHVYRNHNEGQTMQAMNRAAKTDPAMAERVRVYRYRVPEELYDLAADPDCLVNLIDRPERRETADRMRAELRAWMERTGDPLLPAFDRRGEREKVDEVIERMYQ